MMAVACAVWTPVVFLHVCRYWERYQQCIWSTDSRKSATFGWWDGHRAHGVYHSNRSVSDTQLLTHKYTGFPRVLGCRAILFWISKDLESPTSEFGPWKSWKLKLKVLEYTCGSDWGTWIALNLHLLPTVPCKCVNKCTECWCRVTNRSVFLRPVIAVLWCIVLWRCTHGIRNCQSSSSLNIAGLHKDPGKHSWRCCRGPGIC